MCGRGTRSIPNCASRFATAGSGVLTTRHGGVLSSGTTRMGVRERWSTAPAAAVCESSGPITHGYCRDVASGGSRIARRARPSSRSTGRVRGFRAHDRLARRQRRRGLAGGSPRPPARCVHRRREPPTRSSTSLQPPVEPMLRRRRRTRTELGPLARGRGRLAPSRKPSVRQSVLPRRGPVVGASMRAGRQRRRDRGAPDDGLLVDAGRSSSRRRPEVLARAPRSHYATAR